MLAIALLTILQLGASSVEVEIADAPKSRGQGLSGKGELAEGHGMLFVFEQAAPLAFQMRETAIPLSIGFFDQEQTLIQIEDMAPFSSKLTCSKRPAQYALEVPQGWFDREKISLGAKFSFQRESIEVE